MHYVDEGKGHPVVMFHACPMWSFAYRNLIREFSQDHRVIAFDLPGFGFSTAGRHFAYSLDSYINATEVFLESMEIEDATLILHGWGGTVGMGDYAEGGTANAPIPQKAGDYTFQGYYTEGGVQVFDASGALMEGTLAGLPSEVNLYAHWAVPEGSTQQQRS